MVLYTLGVYYIWISNFQLCKMPHHIKESNCAQLLVNTLKYNFFLYTHISQQCWDCNTIAPKRKFLAASKITLKTSAVGMSFYSIIAYKNRSITFISAVSARLNDRSQHYKHLKRNIRTRLKRAINIPVHAPQ